MSMSFLNWVGFWLLLFNLLCPLQDLENSPYCTQTFAWLNMNFTFPSYDVNKCFDVNRTAFEMAHFVHTFPGRRP